jgi:hypothetical protein
MTAMQIRPMEEWEDNESNDYVSDEETYTDTRLLFCYYFDPNELNRKVQWTFLIND